MARAGERALSTRGAGIGVVPVALASEMPLRIPGRACGVLDLEWEAATDHDKADANRPYVSSAPVVCTLSSRESSRVAYTPELHIFCVSWPASTRPQGRGHKLELSGKIDECVL